MSAYDKREDQELRERCVNLAANVFRGPGVTGQQLTTVAEHFFQYIKNGGGTDNGYADVPTPPVNTGPGMGVIREVADIRSKKWEDHPWLYRVRTTPDDGFHAS